jgi:hypothetical protein
MLLTVNWSKNRINSKTSGNFHTSHIFKAINRHRAYGDLSLNTLNMVVIYFCDIKGPNKNYAKK